MKSLQGSLILDGGKLAGSEFHRTGVRIAKTQLGQHLILGLRAHVGVHSAGNTTFDSIRFRFAARKTALQTGRLRVESSR